MAPVGTFLPAKALLESKYEYLPIAPRVRLCGESLFSAVHYSRPKPSSCTFPDIPAQVLAVRRLHRAVRSAVALPFLVVFSLPPDKGSCCSSTSIPPPADENGRRGQQDVRTACDKLGDVASLRIEVNKTHVEQAEQIMTVVSAVGVLT